MVGNDIIDLEQARRDSNWQRKGYLEKICTENEQELILRAAVPATMLWLLWSMKEAAYKVENRRSDKRFYAPKSFSCTKPAKDGSFNWRSQPAACPPRDESTVCTAPYHCYGTVTYQGRLFYVTSVVSDKYIHSIAVASPAGLQHVRICYQQNQPDYVQDFALRHPGYSLIKDKAGLPAIIHHRTGLKHAASVSHHGLYLAVIYSDSLQLKD